MSYSRTTWENETTPLSAQNMNNIEDGIQEALAAASTATIKTTILNLFYPIGSYYETSDSSFNPNTAWGGTWVKNDEVGRMHVGAGTGYSIGTKSGSTDPALVPHYHVVPLTQTANDGNGPQITGGTHSHAVRREQTAASGSNRYAVAGSASQVEVIAVGGNGNGYHVHSMPKHQHVIPQHNTDGPNVSTGTKNNMPPYVAVNRWHRTA